MRRVVVYSVKSHGAPLYSDTDRQKKERRSAVISVHFTFNLGILTAIKSLLIAKLFSDFFFYGIKGESTKMKPWRWLSIAGKSAF